MQMKHECSIRTRNQLKSIPMPLPIYRIHTKIQVLINECFIIHKKLIIKVNTINSTYPFTKSFLLNNFSFVPSFRSLPAKVYCGARYWLFSISQLYCNCYCFHCTNNVTVFYNIRSALQFPMIHSIDYLSSNEGLLLFLVKLPLGR